MVISNVQQHIYVSEWEERNTKELIKKSLNNSSSVEKKVKTEENKDYTGKIIHSTTIIES